MLDSMVYIVSVLKNVPIITRQVGHGRGHLLYEKTIAAKELWPSTYNGFVIYCIGPSLNSPLLNLFIVCTKLLTHTHTHTHPDTRERPCSPGPTGRYL